MNRVIIDADWVTFAMIGQCLWGAMLAHTMRIGFYPSGSAVNE
jgi:hypothetical protein